ncbi:MAG: FAD-dependent oxidoreductase [Giesbergeria sp.]
MSRPPIKEGRRLNTIITESKSGRQAWRAPVFIDTTGDGDLGALAGCDFEFGESKDCPCQPMSLNALLVCKDAASAGRISCMPSDPKQRSALPRREFLEAEIKAHGSLPLLQQPDALAGAGQSACW